ncbi:ABC transporter ATP-binding protein [Ancylobacter lacus]|uniref:ABC transporter ATP-binding protein n=1 Tax=Ancylobacter lacus TaxID=2579970 RepID=UPI001BCA95B8|nr:ABC transporter ATP-binding protein [Ancylobacter lacus]MBS7538602.1 ABC transporter ATP-binding protein [Ancylobacter lacus]
MKLPVSASESFVEFAGIQKTYDGEVLVVKDLNLRIRRGEFLTLLGPSGSGKTTTLMMLAGFETPTVGNIMLDGERIDAVPPEKRDIGMVFQNYALFPHMSVAQNVGFPLKVRGVSKAETAQRVARALDMVELGKFATRMPGQLSGGQQQRVALARALVFEPKLVLMDEPLGALDKQLREHMQIEIRHLHERLGITVVYVTHDQSEALTMSDRVAVFNAGIIQQIAPPAELYESPENSFVAQFIGENNRLPGRIESASGTLCTVKLANGSTVAATLTRAAGVGDACLLSVRPERVKIAPAAGAVDNLFEANVAELIYLGDHLRVRCVLDSGAEVVVKVGNAEDRPVLDVGTRIPLGWRAQDCRALDAA